MICDTTQFCVRGNDIDLREVTLDDEWGRMSGFLEKCAAYIQCFIVC